MKMKSRQLKLPYRSVRAAISSSVFIAVVLVLPISHAQQDRQLVQNGSQPVATNVKRIALVIGNGAYTSAPPLKNPPNDARDMAATLRTLGFDVVSGINVNQKDMKRLIREFGIKLKTGGSGLFYYAGHGVQSKGRNYLIPIDADIQSEAEAEDSGVDAGLVLNYMDDAQNGLNIVILDACRNNPFARSFRSATDGLAQVDAPTGTLIAYATAPGRVASDGTAQNGLYTAELLKQMRVPGLSVTDMFMRVRAEVMKQTGNKQVPWEASSLVGAFYFAGSSSDATPVTNTAKIDPVAFELSYWETIKNSTNADDFKAYLARYPQGQFAELAKNRISTLSTPAKPSETSSPVTGGSATELAFWDSVKNSNNASDYRAYLEKYPNGEFAVLAKNRLAPLDIAEKEKANAEELARQIKSFKAKWIRGKDNFSGSLVLASAKSEFVFDDSSQSGKGAFTCGSFQTARLDGSFIREVHASESNPKKDSRINIQAQSDAEARDAFVTMRRICGNAPLPDGATGANALIGTIWRGTSSGGDKRYEFQFLANGVLAWYLKWHEIDYTYPGTWRLNDNTLIMVPDGWEKMEAAVSQNQISGSWAGGQYKFTLTKFDPNPQTLSLAGTVWTGDSPGGDKHYEFRFQSGGIVVWHQKMAQNVTYEGMWSQNGDKVTMNFRGLDDPVLMSIQGNQMTGSWYHGRYQLTVTKVQ
jgi:hypothetical protein